MQQLLKNDLIRNYFNGKAAAWDTAIAEKNTAKLQSMADRLHIPTGSAILDVGSGTGVFIPFLLRKIGDTGRIVAIDIAEEMLKISIAKYHGSNVTFIQADIIRSPLTGGMFDAIVCYSSFPHFNDKSRALCEMTRLLKPSGFLYICHTSSRSFINTIHRNISLLEDDLLPDESAMRSLLNDAGFDTICIKDEEDNYLLSAVKKA